MTHHRNLGLAVAAALLLAGPAQAQRQVNASRDAASNGTVEITMGTGSVRVIGWSRGQVQVTGTVSGRDEVELDGGGRMVEVRVGGRRRGSAAHLEVRVPAGSSVHVTAGAAPVTVTGVTGAVESTSESGQVSIQGNPRSVEVVAQSGPVTVEGRTDRVEVTAMSGPVRISADVRQRVEVEAMSGPVDLLGSVGELEVNALSGPVRIANATGRIEVEAVSGNVSITGTRLRGNVNGVSGNIVVAGSLAGPLTLETHSGDVELRLPGGAAAEVEVATFNGDFRSDFGGARESRESRHERRVSIGRGGPAVRITTFSGDVKLLRR